jgi:hypothetical protein
MTLQENIANFRYNVNYQAKVYGKSCLLNYDNAGLYERSMMHQILVILKPMVKYLECSQITSDNQRFWTQKFKKQVEKLNKFLENVVRYPSLYPIHTVEKIYDFLVPDENLNFRSLYNLCIIY